MKNVITRVLLVVLVGLTACSPKLPEIAPNTTPVIPSSISPQPADSPNTTPPASPPPPGAHVTVNPPMVNVSMPLQAKVVPENSSYLPGKPVTVTLSLTNVSSAPLSVNLYPPQIRVAPVMDWDRVIFSVAGGTRSRELKPGEIVSVTFTWDQKDKAGRQVTPGWYNIIFGDISVIQGEGRITFTPGASMLIQYPQAAMEKTITLNQSQTVNGITITLERIELTSNGTVVRCFFIPPGYKPQPAGPGLPTVSPPTADISASAEYTVGGITKPAGTSGFNGRANGIILVWGNGPARLDPVPADAKEIIFTITTLFERVPLDANPVEVTGPWEFRIPLQ
ncbi:MAG: hypothetical protein Q7R50_05980 [Dehalococcoidales bacterium]|nr:hypothetical protein [Dehalococcoidales bacterium]